jgi:hypothetical protein
MSSLLQLAKRDSNHFVTKGGFETEITVSTPAQDKTVTLTGFATKHWISFDTDGNSVNSKNVHVCLSETALVNAGIQVRKSNKEISLLKHYVSYADSSGLVKDYIVSENYPDETLGLIVLILKDYK